MLRSASKDTYGCYPPERRSKSAIRCAACLSIRTLPNIKRSLKVRRPTFAAAGGERNSSPTPDSRARPLRHRRQKLQSLPRLRTSRSIPVRCPRRSVKARPGVARSAVWRSTLKAFCRQQGRVRIEGHDPAVYHRRHSGNPDFCMGSVRSLDGIESRALRFDERVDVDSVRARYTHCALVRVAFLPSAAGPVFSGGVGGRVRVSSAAPPATVVAASVPCQGRGWSASSQHIASGGRRLSQAIRPQSSLEFL